MKRDEATGHLAGEGEASHKFDPERFEKLSDPERLRELRLEDLLKHLGVSQGDSVLDLGTGAGVFLPPLREAVGEAGEVVGSDTSSEMLKKCREQFGAELPANLELSRNEPDSLPFEAVRFDRVLMVCLLHELAAPAAMLQEVARVLKPDGRVLVLDWAKQEAEKGPPEGHRVSREEARRLLAENGFTGSETKTWGNEYYVTLAVAPANVT